MIGNAYLRRAIQRDTFEAIGRWPGSNAPANGLYPPATRADGGAICKGLTLTRTGVGLYTLQFIGPSNVSSSVPYILESGGYVLTPTGVLYLVIPLTEVATTGTVTIKITTAAGVATDPPASETICLYMILSSAGQP